MFALTIFSSFACATVPAIAPAATTAPTSRKLRRLGFVEVGEDIVAAPVSERFCGRSYRLGHPKGEKIMDEHAPFLNAIVESPDDDALRLVYADDLQDAETRTRLSSQCP